MSTEKLSKIFADVIRKRMPDVNIVSVTVARDVDSDGDDLLDVTIVFEAKNDLDASKVAGLIRHMRPELNKRGEHGFPIMSFISRKEAEKSGFAPA